MFRPTSAVESLGSCWYFDDEAKLYIRTPKSEGPRPPGPHGEDWGGPGAGTMQDYVTHGYTSWHIQPDTQLGPCDLWEDEPTCCPHLWVVNGTHVLCTAPQAEVLLDSSLSIS